MNLPATFVEARTDVLAPRRTAIPCGDRSAGLAILVTQTPDGLLASHVPMLLDPEPAPYGTVLGHLARANPQGRHPVDDGLAIFQGPDAYITPSWYAAKQTTGKVVPTWNYVAVHASGPVTFFEHPADCWTSSRA